VYISDVQLHKCSNINALFHSISEVSVQVQLPIMTIAVILGPYCVHSCLFYVIYLL